MAETISMADHYTMMNSQQTSLLGVVEVVRRRLVAHGVAVSHLAQKVMDDKWEASCIVTELIKTIEAREKARQNLPLQDTAGSNVDDKANKTAFYDPVTEQFKQELTPLMLKVTDAFGKIMLQILKTLLIIAFQALLRTNLQSLLLITLQKLPPVHLP